MDVVQYKGKKFEPKNEKKLKVRMILNKSHYVVTDLEPSGGSKPRAPFITSTYNKLQARYGFGVRKPKGTTFI